MRRLQPAASVTAAAGAAAIAGLNYYFSGELFRTAYLDNLQSNEGAMATLGRFFASHPFARWYPLWNIGMPVENTYPPLGPWLIAAVTAITGVPAALALHILAGLFFCLLPVAWFWTARRWGVGTGCALSGALLYSLLSPVCLFFPVFRTDLAHRLDSRRMMDVAYYGDIAHMMALALLPLALLFLERVLRGGRRRDWLAALALAGAVVLSNSFGMTILALASCALVAALDSKYLRRALWRLALAGVLTYLLVSPRLTPRLLLLTSHNSQMVGGDFRFSLTTPLGYALLAAGLLLIRRLMRGANFSTRFLAGFTWLFGAIPLLFYTAGIVTLPQVLRYHLEIDLGLCFLAAMAVWRLPERPRYAVLALAFVAAVPVAIHVRRFDRGLLGPIDMAQSAEYKTAAWTGRNLPGRRVMVSGDTEFWFNLFAENPQLSAGHEPYAPNYMQRVAVYTIYSGANAGARDAWYSIFWLKAFGAAAVHVPGTGSPEHYHPFVNPRKFEGVLEKLWNSDDDAVYAVPLHSQSLAHVVPAGAIVSREPIHGLDTTPAQAYVDALDDASIPEAPLAWESTDRGRIHAQLAPGQVVSVQVTYDPGWEAHVGGRKVEVRADKLGMIVIEPACTGPCEIELEFTGGTERMLCGFASLATALGLAGWALVRRLRGGRQSD